MKTLDERVVDCLIEDGVLTADQLCDALDTQKQHGGQLTKLLVEHRLVGEDDVAVSMAACLGVSPIRIAEMNIPTAVIDLIPRELAFRHKIAPVAFLGRKLFVTMADPLNVLALDEVRRTLPRWEIVPMMSTEKGVTDFLHTAHNGGTGIDDILKDVDHADIELKQEVADNANLDQLIESSREEPVIKLVNSVLAQAVKDGASDVHFEPFERQVRLRYRIDGVMYELRPVPKSLQAGIVSRIKVISKLDIAEHRLPQDGRFRIRLLGREVDLRVSVVPTVHGEKIALRLLDKNRLATNLAALDMDASDLEKFSHAIEAPHGMILITGPTGSGKTSTLYAALTQLNTSDVHIVTVEDPVEYQLPGINQIHVNADIGMTFASGLRSILRQDPDIVMVGEIRDFETADIAVKAALTGHLVLSTLHTNDAPGAIARLLDMGIEPFLASSSVVMVCAQRLIRKVCPHCKEPFTLTADIIARLRMDKDEASSHVFYRGRGCGRCKQTGFHGRVAILEVLPVSAAIREQVLHKASTGALKELAIREGMRTLRQAGLAKAQAGLTSLDEVLRVTSNDH